MWAVLPALLSIYWFDQKRYEKSALALGIAIATKFFPIVLLLPASLIVLKQKRELIRYNAIALGTAVLINLPFALTAPKGWWRFYKLNLERSFDWGSLWHAATIFGLKSNSLNYLSALTFLVGAALFAIYFLDIKRLDQSAIFIVALFVTSSKVYSPQYVLWLTPLAVIAIRNKREVKAFWVWQLGELIYHIAIWQHLALTVGAHFGLSDRAYALAVLIRIAGLAYFLRALFATKSGKSPAFEPAQALEFPL
jgi:uncharacterized membrane protein